ncbi:MAG: hypothetical protein IKI97_04860 [Clostridia bacterium]|nr:hypothetical protein [Clostridia bacterium]
MKGLKSYIIAGILFVSVLGTFFHFVYEWSDNNFFVGLFAPINESVWEHTKLIFFPILIYAVFLNKNLKNQYPCITSALGAASLLGVLLIIILYYTYSGITGFNVAFADISIFYISVIASFYAAYKLTLSCGADKFSIILQILNIVMIFLFIAFTLSPPNIPLFINP